jgi:hypothetical protein
VRVRNNGQWSRAARDASSFLVLIFVNFSQVAAKEYVIAGKTYNWPTDKNSVVMPEAQPGAGTNALMSKDSWSKILKASVPGFTPSPDPGFEHTVAIFKLRPNAIEWDGAIKDNRPPLSIAVASDGDDGAMHYWQPTEWRLSDKPRFITYDGMTDAYVRCDRLQSKVTNCYAYWNDNGVLHTFSIFRNNIRYVPAIIKAYISEVKR